MDEKELNHKLDAVFTSAENELSSLCSGNKHFHMSIPVMSSDSDVVLGGAIKAGREALAEVVTLRADLTRERQRAERYERLLKIIRQLYVDPDQEQTVEGLWKIIFYWSIAASWALDGEVFDLASALPELTYIKEFMEETDPRQDAEAKGDYRKARGIIPWKEGDEPPEVLIRQMRDSEAADSQGVSGEDVENG